MKKKTSPPKISIIVPVYNEMATLDAILTRLKLVRLPGWIKEIIIVDDGSNDGSREYLLKKSASDIQLCLHKKNQGKGAAIRTGIHQASGEYILIQDADLEYNPNDIAQLLAEVEQEDAPVVYGSRFKGQIQDSVFLHREANLLLTFFTNILYGSNLSDMETCYKLMRSDIVKSLPLQAKKFEFEPEITAKLLRQGIPIVEIPISYTKRDYKAGKKIQFQDFFQAIWTLIKYRLIATA